MISFLQQLLKFWLVLLFAAFGGYLLIFNQERIYVNLPGIGEFRVMAAIAFLICFALGASAVIFYFGTEIIKKTWEIKRQGKRIRWLEKKLEELGSLPADLKKKSWFGNREPAIETPSPSPAITIPSSKYEDHV